MIPRGGPRFVYFVRLASGDGPIKIGCSMEPRARLESLMLWSPLPLAIMATMPGDYQLEQRWHRRFAAQHSHREWFRPSLELLQFIDSVREGAFELGMLDVPPGTRSINYRPEHSAWISARAAVRRLERQGHQVPADVASALHNSHGLTLEEKRRRVAIVDTFVAKVAA